MNVFEERESNVFISCYRLHYQFVMTSIEWTRVLLYENILYKNRILFRLLGRLFRIVMIVFVFGVGFGLSRCALFILWIGASASEHMLRIRMRIFYELVSCLVPVE